ncbi:MAG: hypothetical protein R2911_37370 [Caldilineaceae bacterium]
MDEAALDALWQRARANAGQALPDPNNRYRLELPAGADLVTARPIQPACR